MNGSQGGRGSLGAASREARASSEESREMLLESLQRVFYSGVSGELNSAFEIP